MELTEMVPFLMHCTQVCMDSKGGINPPFDHMCIIHFKCQGKVWGAVKVSNHPSEFLVIISVGPLTLVIMNATGVCMSGWARLHKNKSFAVR